MGYKDLETRRQKSYERHTRQRAVAKDLVFKHLGDKCANPDCGWTNVDGTRGCTDRRCLQIDHVNGGGEKERTETHHCRETLYKRVLADTEGTYQLLCANCNWIKRQTNAIESVGRPLKTDFATA